MPCLFYFLHPKSTSSQRQEEIVGHPLTLNVSVKYLTDYRRNAGRHRSIVSAQFRLNCVEFDIQNKLAELTDVGKLSQFFS